MREELLEDLRTEEQRGKTTLEGAKNINQLKQMKQATPARIGIGCAGPRLKTHTYLSLRADHAGAMDSVLRQVDSCFLEKMGLFTIKTMCSSRLEYITRPDLGRKLEEKDKQELLKRCKKKPAVQIYVGDGLSSQAIEANIADLLPALFDGLEDEGISVGTPFFMEYARVPAMDVVSEVLEPELTCVLIGERPGLATASSLSAYIAYGAWVGMPESNRIVVSNIHKGGIPPVEAGAHIAQLLKTILEKKQSGVSV